jgi:hypothetical protein
MAQQTSEKLRIPLMILAALSIAGFVWWLAVYTEPTQFATAAEDSSAEGAARSLTLQEFSAAYASFQGVQVSVDGIEIATLLGPQIFLTALPDGTPFVVRFPVGAGAAPWAGGDVVSLRGQVEAMSESVLDQWQDTGVFTDPTARDIAGFGSHYFNADLVAYFTPAAADAGEVEGDASESN